MATKNAIYANVSKSETAPQQIPPIAIPRPSSVRRIEIMPVMTAVNARGKVNKLIQQYKTTLNDPVTSETIANVVS